VHSEQRQNEEADMPIPEAMAIDKVRAELFATAAQANRHST